MAFLIMLGGLSFAVISDLVRVRRFSRFSLDTKIIVVASVALWALGAVVVFGFEYDRPETLGAMPLGQKFVHAAFESITARAGGVQHHRHGRAQLRDDLLHHGADVHRHRVGVGGRGGYG